MQGLPFDRFLGIVNGHTDIPRHGWCSHTGFARMICDGQLSLFNVTYDAVLARMSLGAPNGDSVKFDLAI